MTQESSEKATTKTKRKYPEATHPPGRASPPKAPLDNPDVFGRRLNRVEAANFLGVSTMKIRKLQDEGALEALIDETTGATMYSEAELTTYREKNNQQAAEAIEAMKAALDAANKQIEDARGQTRDLFEASPKYTKLLLEGYERMVEHLQERNRFLEEERDKSRDVVERARTDESAREIARYQAEQQEARRNMMFAALVKFAPALLHGLNLQKFLPEGLQAANGGAEVVPNGEPPKSAEERLGDLNCGLCVMIADLDEQKFALLCQFCEPDQATMLRDARSVVFEVRKNYAEQAAKEGGTT